MRDALGVESSLSRASLRDSQETPGLIRVLHKLRFHPEHPFVRNLVNQKLRKRTQSPRESMVALDIPGKPRRRL